MEKAWSLALWCVLVCYNTGYRVGKLPGLPSRQKGIMSMSMELGETVASWVEFPNGWYLHSDDADAEFTQDGAKTYLQRLKSVWMESPFWDSVKAMEEKPQ